MNPILRVQDLQAFYVLGVLGKKRVAWAVNGVSLSIDQDEVYGIAGESGCGKTTTARIILGFEYPTRGEILYQGKPVGESLRHKRWFREVQAVFQNLFETFNPLRKVESYFLETVRNFGLAPKGKTALSLIDQRLQAVGLSWPEIAGKYPSEFSGGQLQRASIARALLPNPSLLVADEPVSMVDALLRMSIVNLFRNLCDIMGVSVLYITHDLAAAYYVSDRIAVMFRGNIVEEGPVEEVLGNPRHPYTRLLLSSIPKPDPEWCRREEVVVCEEKEEYLRAGCKFAGRCGEVGEICLKEVPQNVLLGDVLVHCHQYHSKKEV